MKDFNVFNFQLSPPFSTALYHAAARDGNGSNGWPDSGPSKSNPDNGSSRQNIERQTLSNPEPLFKCIGCPPGLQYLTMVDQLLIKQKVEVLEVVTGIETANKYEVLNSMGQHVGGLSSLVIMD